MKKYMRLYWIFIKISIRKQMIYRSAYLAGIVGQWLDYGAIFATLYIMVNKFTTLSGWNGSEVMILFGFSLLAYALGAALFYTPSVELTAKVRSGDFDQSLTKPIHPFLHEMFQGFNPGYVSHITLSVTLIAVSMIHLHCRLDFINIVLLLMMLFGAVLIQAAVLITSAAASFFTINENPIIEFLLFDMKAFMNYPITIFPRAIQFLLTFLLPYAFINFYPAAVLLGKDIPSGYPSALPYFSPLIGLLAFILSIFFWNRGLSHYKSTGS